MIDINASLIIISKIPSALLQNLFLNPLGFDSYEIFYDRTRKR
jgi:hypothetical protein